MRLVKDERLPSRIISSPFVVEFVGLPDRTRIEHVRAGKCILFRQFMVDLDGEVILWGDLLTRKAENPSVPFSQRWAVGQRIKSIHKTEDIRIHRDLPRGEVASPSVRRRHGIHLRRTQGRAQALVITANEGTIFLDRPSHRSSKLIAAEGWLLGVKEIPRVEGAVSKELIDRAVKLACP